MGCDGGTIPQRKEIVKNKRKEKAIRKREVDKAEKWKTCALSGCFLRKPIVASPYGYLIDKQEVIEHLIEWKQDRLSAYHRIEDHPGVLSPIQSTKDIIELKLKDNPNKSSRASTSEDEMVIPDFVCPITGLETNGTYTFLFPWTCGCVVSERALKEVPNNDACLVCQTPYKEYDLVIINPNSKELTRNQAAFLVRKTAAAMAKEGLMPKSKSQKTKSSSSRVKSSATLSNSSGPSTSSMGPSANSASDRPTTSTSSSGQTNSKERSQRNDRREASRSPDRPHKRKS